MYGEIPFPDELDGGAAAYTRTRFVAHLAGRLAELPAPLPSLALISVILPGLPGFRDRYGERAAEQLRQQVYSAIRQFVPGTIVGQLAESQFVLTYEFDPEWTDVEDLASDIRAVIAESSGGTDYPSGSPPLLGGAVHDARSPRTSALDLATELLRRANLAARAVSRDAKDGFVLYSPAEDERVRTNLRLDHSLRQALVKHEFRLFYQPIVDLRTFEMVGLEGLVRWDSPLAGLRSPDEFIPAAETSGLIVQIGAAVIEIAMRQVGAWHAAGWAPPRVSVNVAGAQLQDDRFRDTIVHAVTSGALKPENLELELTERTLITWSNSARRLLEEMREMGIGVALDDFGTGYSSVQYLRDMPVSKLKIDRTFVRSIATDPRDAALAKAFVEIANALGLEIVAEGIEEQEQAEVLLQCGCTMGQGFLFSRPQPAAALSDIVGRLKRQSWNAAQACTTPLKRPAFGRPG